MTQSQRCAASTQTAKVVGRRWHRREGHERAKQSRGLAHWQHAVCQQAAPPVCRQHAGSRQTVSTQQTDDPGTRREGYAGGDQGNSDRQAVGNNVQVASNDVQVVGNSEQAVGNNEQVAVGRGG